MPDKFVMQVRRTEVVFDAGELELDTDNGYWKSGWYFWMDKEETRKLYDAMKEYYDEQAKG